MVESPARSTEEQVETRRLKSPEWWGPGSQPGRGACSASLSLELSWQAAGARLGEEGGGQSGGLPSWKRPRLIVPD